VRGRGGRRGRRQQREEKIKWEKQKVSQSDGRDRCLDLCTGRGERGERGERNDGAAQSMKLEANVTKEIEQEVAEGWTDG
jgi:hypothetical protein